VAQEENATALAAHSAGASNTGAFQEEGRARTVACASSSSDRSGSDSCWLSAAAVSAGDPLSPLLEPSEALGAAAASS